MRLSEIDPSLAPENIPAQDVVRSLHRAFKNRYYYLALSLISPVLFPLLFKLTVLLIKQSNKKNTQDLPTATIMFMILYMNLLEWTIGLFNLGTQNRFDPVDKLVVPDARSALRTLMRTVPGIYANNISETIATSPEYATPNRNIRTQLRIVDEQDYTPLKLAQELGASNVLQMFDQMVDENRIIYLILRSYLQKDSDLKSLNSDTLIRILSYFAGSKISELFSNEPPFTPVHDFVADHSRQQRHNIPQFLKYFETKLSAQVNLHGQAKGQTAPAQIPARPSLSW